MYVCMYLCMFGFVDVDDAACGRRGGGCGGGLLLLFFLLVEDHVHYRRDREYNGLIYCILGRIHGANMGLWRRSQGSGQAAGGSWRRREHQGQCKYSPSMRLTRQPCTCTNIYICICVSVSVCM